MDFFARLCRVESGHIIVNGKPIFNGSKKIPSGLPLSRSISFAIYHQNDCNADKMFRQVCLRNAAHVLEWCGSVWLTRFTLSRDTSIYNIEFMTYCLAFCCWEYSLIALWIDLKPFLEISSRWRWGILWTCINIYCIYIYPVPGFKKWEKPSILHTLWCWFSSPCRETV